MNSKGFLGGSVGKESSCNAGDAGDLDSTSRWRRYPGRGHGNHFSVLAWRTPWTEEPGGLQPMGSQRAGHS